MAELPHSISVLQVEDDSRLAEIVASLLVRADNQITVRTATDPDDGLDALETHAGDCIVSDCDMSVVNGIEFLEAVRADHPERPFILYTDKGSEEVASDAISAGVTDYLQKEGVTSQSPVLANRIANAVEQYRSKRALGENRKRLSLVFEQSPLGVIEWNEGFDVPLSNEATETFSGTPHRSSSVPRGKPPSPALTKLLSLRWSMTCSGRRWFPPYQREHPERRGADHL